MSTQSILTKSIDSIQELAEKNLLSNAKKYMLKKRFMLGDGMCKDSAVHSLTLLSFICTENCELQKFIKGSIEGTKRLKNTCAYTVDTTGTIVFSDYAEIFEDNLD